MKIYTRTGDDGTTGLLGGRRVSKADPHIECCGAVDELNAALGLAAAVAPLEILSCLRQIQGELFVVGANLASSGEAPSPGLPALDDSALDRLERQIDQAETQVSPLRQFILPGGSELSARLHLARTICRRAERRLIELASAIPSHTFVPYLNRLSDWLFVHARLANSLASVDDVPWSKPR